MSRKDYQRIARAIYETRKEDSDANGLRTLDTLTLRLASIMAEGNPRFDRQRFITACETGSR